MAIRYDSAEPSEWSAAAVAHNHSQLYADVQDFLDSIDAKSLLDDVFASQDADASYVAFQELVDNDWTGEL